jgi:HD-like signal output (HDOD) protein
MSVVECMPVTDTATAAAVDKFIASHGAVSALPENGTRIIRMASERDADTKELLKLISKDAALTGRIMKAVNSAFYALPTKITRLDRAVAFMGMKAVMEVALSATLAGMCKNRSFGTYDDRDLWDHSVGVATMARELAIKSKTQDPEEAFLVGMIHDIGLLTMAQAEEQKVAQVFVGAEQGQPYKALEKQHFGFDHTELGYRLATGWKFPDATSMAIRMHHQPEKAPEEYRALCQHLYISDTLACQSRKGCPLTCGTQAVTDAQLSEAGLTREIADAAVEKLPMLLRLFAN